MHKFIACVAMLVSLPVAAQSSASASFSGLTWSLTDLNANDGINPYINFDVSFAGSHKVIGETENWMSNTANGPITYTQAKGDTASSELSSPVRFTRAAVFDKSISVSAGALDNNGTYGASGYLALSVDFDPRKFGKVFELSANTSVTFAALADIATTGGATGEVWLLAGKELSVWADQGQHLLQASFSNTTDASVNSWYNGSARVNFDSFAFAEPVPEPETYALMLVGLLAVGLVTRKRTKAAGISQDRS